MASCVGHAGIDTVYIFKLSIFPLFVWLFLPFVFAFILPECVCVCACACVRAWIHCPYLHVRSALHVHACSSVTTSVSENCWSVVTPPPPRSLLFPSLPFCLLLLSSLFFYIVFVYTTQPAPSWRN
mmetsp:Transcript_18288/g.45747  ORF Transcript_18288/g.45747 Transcript_18288/m.45747 type:complete len:126 (+) Transcript_18288:1349-1726(+)